MTRFATERRVFFFEEPLFDSEHSDLRVRVDQCVNIVEPHLPSGLPPEAINGELRRLLGQLTDHWKIDEPVLWYYTPMALSFSRDLPASVVVFDCMDELSAFHGAPRELLDRESELLAKADVVFTGGQSLFEAKRARHPRVFAFPSSVDVSHFAQARRPQPEPPDQARIPGPRLGYVGVIDERMDLPLVDAVAQARPSWQLVLLGPTAKIDPATLPRRPNIHYLGMKKYDELPAYLAGWDVALLPFARNDATRFISPTKTPEYLAAGRPVVSTSVRDVVRPYGEMGFVQIADQPNAFIAAAERAMAGADDGRLRVIDAFLADISWDRTWAAMRAQIDEAVARRSRGREPRRAATPSAGRDAIRPSL